MIDFRPGIAQLIESRVSVATKSGTGSDLLADIVAGKREEVAQRRARVPEQQLECEARRQVRRPFAPALVRAGRSIIAEMKQASPSRGRLRDDYSPQAMAKAFEEAGARALSVLTDGPHFQGTLEHLREARQAARLPVLRKDFIVDPYQVTESAAAGADAVLLIVAAVNDATLQALYARAMGLGMDALVEVHTEEDVDRASALGARLIGVNNRNLATMAVDVETSLRLRERLPSRAITVSESGLGSREELARLEAAGYRAFLIGEQLMSSAEPGSALRALL